LDFKRTIEKVRGKKSTGKKYGKKNLKNKQTGKQVRETGKNDEKPGCACAHPREPLWGHEYHCTTTIVRKNLRMRTLSLPVPRRAASGHTCAMVRSPTRYFFRAHILLWCLT